MKLKPTKPLDNLRPEKVRRLASTLLLSASMFAASFSSCEAGMFTFPTNMFIKPGATSGTYVSKVTYYSIAIGSGATSNTQTITSVDTSKTWVQFLGSKLSTGEGSNDKSHARVELSNATTVTATRNTSSTSTLTVYFAVVEATSSLVSSIQQGTITISAATSNTATITSVTTSRSVVLWLGHSTTSTSGNAHPSIAGVTLTNSTTVTANCGASLTMTVGYVVIEFQASVISSVQQLVDTYTTTNTTDSKTITSVTTSRTMLFFGGQKVGNTSAQATGYYSARLTSSTNIDYVKGTSDATTRTMYLTVVEFASGVLNGNVQRGTISVGSGSGTLTLSPSMSTTLTLVSWLGQDNTSAGQSEDATLVNLTQTNSTTVTGTRQTTGDGATVNIAVDVGEFA